MGQRDGEQCVSGWDGVSRVVLCPEMLVGFVCCPHPCLYQASHSISSRWQDSG